MLSLFRSPSCHLISYRHCVSVSINKEFSIRQLDTFRSPTLPPVFGKRAKSSRQQVDTYDGRHWPNTMIKKACLSRHSSMHSHVWPTTGKIKSLSHKINQGQQSLHHQTTIRELTGKHVVICQHQQYHGTFCSLLCQRVTRCCAAIGFV